MTFLSIKKYLTPVKFEKEYVKKKKKSVSQLFKRRCGHSSRQWRRSGVFIANFEHILHFVLVSLLLTLSR